MAYWWVNQGDNYLQEREGGYLWAPLVTSSGASRPDWANMRRLRAGDLVFTYSSRALRGFCVVIADAIPWTTPYPNDYGIEREGMLALATYHTSPISYSYPSLVSKPPDGLGISLVGAFPKLDLPDKPTLGYLYALPDAIGPALWSVIGISEFVMPDPEAPPPPTGPTSKLRLAAARIGQGDFGRGVRKAFGNSCAISGLSLNEPFVLHAAHLKPWVVSNDQEKIDPANGVLLHATLHHAFDAGLFDIDESGKVILSPLLTPNDRSVLGLLEPRSIPSQTLTPRRTAYLRERWNRRIKTR